MRLVFTGLLLACTSFGQALAADAKSATAAATADAKAPEEKLNTYLTDITAGQVSAANLLGVDKSAISTIQTSQDLVAAIHPFISGDQKAGFAIAITPARTNLLPMSGGTYLGSSMWRILGSVTLSYAQNSADIGGASYQKYAVSADASYYVDLADDPIYQGDKAFTTCQALNEAANAKALADMIFAAGVEPGKTDPDTLDRLKQQTSKVNDVLVACMTKILKQSRWNASRISLSVGEGRIKAQNDKTYSLGNYFTLNAILGAGDRAAWNLTVRRAANALDTTTLNTASLKFARSTLAAIRYTYGDVDGSNFRALAEVSNANRGSTSSAKDVFIYAVGIDKSIAKGMWLSFRFGRNRTQTGDKQQNTGMLNLSILPSLTSFTK